MMGYFAKIFLHEISKELLLIFKNFGVFIKQWKTISVMFATHTKKFTIDHIPQFGLHHLLHSVSYIIIIYIYIYIYIYDTHLIIYNNIDINMYIYIIYMIYIYIYIYDIYIYIYMTLPHVHAAVSRAWLLAGSELTTRSCVFRLSLFICM